MVTRLISLSLSTVLLASLGALAIQGAAVDEGRALEAARGLLASGARHVAEDFSRRTANVPQLADRLASSEGLAQDLRALNNAIGMIPDSGRVSERLRQRIESVRGRIEESGAAFRETAPGLQAVTFVSADGIVLATDSKIFSIGDSVVADEDVEADPGEADDGDEASDGEADGESADEPKAAAAKFRITALDGTPQVATLVDKDGVRVLAATAIQLKTKVLGAVIVEVAVAELAQPEGVSAVLLFDGEPVLGTATVGLDPSAIRDEAGAYLMTAVEPHAAVPVLGDVGLSPMFVDAGSAGVWAQNFSIDGATASKGIVVLDVSSTYAAIAGAQVTILIFVILVWLVHAVMIMLSGRRLRSGINRVSDHLGQALQGQTPAAPLDEHGFPSALVNLVRLVNQSAGSGGDLDSLPKSPSVDEVIGVQHVDEGQAVADFEFKGISDSGSIGVDPDSAEGAAETPGESTDDDGYESLEGIAEAAEADVEAVEAEAADAAAKAGGADRFGNELPDASEAFDAIDHLGDDEAAPSEAVDTESAEEPPEPPPVEADVSEATQEEPPSALSKSPPPPPPPKNDLGDQLDEYASDATMVMQLSPELMQAMSAIADKDADTDLDAPAADPEMEAVDDELARLAEGLGEPMPEPPAEPEADLPAEPAEISEDDIVEAPKADPGEAHFRQVFNEFVRTRGTCGESTAELTFEKFKAKLVKSRDAVIAKHKCSDVKFQVYVKNGKAALKALPAR